MLCPYANLRNNLERSEVTADNEDEMGTDFLDVLEEVKEIVTGATDPVPEEIQKEDQNEASVQGDKPSIEKAINEIL